MGQYDQAIDYIRQCPVLQNPKDSANLLNNIDAVYFYKEDLETALHYYERALKLDHDSNLVKSLMHINTGTLLERKCSFNEALKSFSRSLNLITDEFLQARIYNNIGILYDQGLEDGESGLEYYEKALVIYKTTGQLRHSYAETLNNIACVYDTRGEHEKAHELYMEGLCIYEKTLLVGHHDSTHALLNIGTTHYSQDSYDVTIEYYEKALTGFRQIMLVFNLQHVCVIWQMYTGR
ncbi:unnamed protein product [Didymodactylos carnosus]|uniref:Uncharacterized protein n=1 Tax=Didymodactylos carnosus TaxID=1234261 RepID=A0A815FPW4_9BILA|nr:unnamed protein product [Didymodactylos carnosus]CAF1427136.1 unnamed protein product [Didymodactylos carnosus]CAF4181603.1 unnamed protein product [Didymodactylos carnosus]CAF4226058.1 unnamed protein product [Didymodactylos carnosus]